MSQATRGLYALLGIPGIYRFVQGMLAVRDVRLRIVEECIRPREGEWVLDLGCGDATILAYLPSITYLGVDGNPRHIEAARQRYRDRGASCSFQCGDFSLASELHPGRFDLVLALGLLHHLSDEQAIRAVGIARKALKPGGRFFTLDPARQPGSPLLARLLYALDSGCAVRPAAAYEALARTGFPKVQVRIREDLLRLPYAHCILDCAPE